MTKDEAATRKVDRETERLLTELTLLDGHLADANAAIATLRHTAERDVRPGVRLRVEVDIASMTRFVSYLTDRREGVRAVLVAGLSERLIEATRCRIEQEIEEKMAEPLEVEHE